MIGKGNLNSLPSLNVDPPAPLNISGLGKDVASLKNKVDVTKDTWSGGEEEFTFAGDLLGENTALSMNEAQVIEEKVGPGMATWTKLLVRIRGLKCTLFDAMKPTPDDAFSHINAPSALKSKSVIVLSPTLKVFVMGGEEKGQMLGKNYQYDVKMCEFTDLAEMPTPKVEFGSIAT